MFVVACDSDFQKGAYLPCNSLSAVCFVCEADDLYAHARGLSDVVSALHHVFKIQINEFNIWFEKLRMPLKNWFVSGFKTEELQRLERARRLLEAICQGFIKVLEELKVANTSNGEEDVQIVGERTVDERNKVGFAGAEDLDPSDDDEDEDLIDSVLNLVRADDENLDHYIA